jgi:L-alanine-DL-glutamate epimerase-like enolase superfamily enzyme
MDSTVAELSVSTYRVPTPAPEADGTAHWSATELLVVEPVAGGMRGLGWSYCAAPAAAEVVRSRLAEVVVGTDALDVVGSWQRMVAAVRNAGLPGLVSMAIAAVDLALWDLKAKLLETPLDRLLGRSRDAVPVYGSGGFVSMSDEELVGELRRWTAELGISRVKIKVGQDAGRAADRDLARTQLARDTIGGDIELFVDANGGYRPGQARRLGASYDDVGVTWFEEPVPSAQLADLRMLRESLRCDIAAGEYLSSAAEAERMCSARAVDCLQLDVTRCAGITGWLQAAAVAGAHGLEVSAHCAPALHVAPAASIPNLRHIELFADHERIERLLFEGAPVVDRGQLRPSQEPGNGLRLTSQAERFRT